MKRKPPEFRIKPAPRGRRKANVVCIEFLDHCTADGETLDEPVFCQVFGVLYRETETAYYVSSWVADYEPHNSNSEGYLILKSAVSQVIKLG